ncbi:hypothetical protein WME79_45865 [Sorangium sp. So ce726]|uniref:hypothetical protein n=1 Tax=Sorangium sp. So ce726 TaxID=3133319 RepID=UPI003F644304
MIAEQPTASVDFNSIRQGLAELPRADNHAPGQPVDPGLVYVVSGHRSALDPERTLVVGNRGMGKSFWAHALAQKEIREEAAQRFRQPDLYRTSVEIGFNASEQTGRVAPSLDIIRQMARDHRDSESVWRAVIARAAVGFTDHELPTSFIDLVSWVEADAERYGHLVTAADARLAATGRKLLVVFDALDRLGKDWSMTRELTRGLLRRALAARSFRAIRLKLFMRLDQFSDQALFDFPDASKIRNTRVDLDWTTSDLYGLLFNRLSRSPHSGEAFSRLVERLKATAPVGLLPADVEQKQIVDSIAGEFMGADKKRGFVFTWLPNHLSDARGQTSPRTFLTAWREAAHHGAPPAGRAVDHLGLLEGVRKASEDRLTELGEEYRWVRTVLEPLRGQMVPMEQEFLESLWRKRGTAQTLLTQPATTALGLAPVQLADPGVNPEKALVDALQTIGVLEIRSSGKINVPDIFRVEAGIKRKGGVKPPRRTGSADG